MKELTSKSIHRCPKCNINDITPIDNNEWKQEYNEGFRYYCAGCDMCYIEPVIDLSDILKIIKKLKKIPYSGTEFDNYTGYEINIIEQVCNFIEEELK